MRKSILDILKEKVLVIDGAMGTLLLNSGVPASSCFEQANHTYPELICKVHQAYIDAGADILETNTFGGSPLKLAHYGLAAQAYELNRSGVELARSVAGPERYVAASMGPCGKLLQPVGTTSFDEVYEGFAIQAKAFADGGADMVCIETMGDLSELKAAVLAVKEHTSLPVMCSITYDQNLYTMTGSDPYLVYVTLAAMGVEVVGTNCGMGPDGMLKVITQYAQARAESGSHAYLSCMPNAGLPQLIDKKTVYNMAPESFATYVEQFVSLGVSIVGGCCGTTPEHIAVVRREIDAQGAQPSTNYAHIIRPELTVLTSRNKCVFVSPSHLPLVIGERLNPTARKILAEDLLEQTTDRYYQEAKEQLIHQPALLDVNVGYPGINESDAMESIVMMLTKHFDVPLCLDSANPLVLEKGLRGYPGKALINSVNGEEKSLQVVLPLAKKYGAAVIGLTLDENGIPAKAEQRLLIAQKIVQRAEALGIPRSDIFIDTLVLAASSNQEDALETIKALDLVKRQLGVKTSLGISNISHGLPKRKLINHVYMAMAFGAGLDALIANPLDPFVRSLIAASAVITNRDRTCLQYIANYDSLLTAEPGDASKASISVSKATSAEDDILNKIANEPKLSVIARKVIDGDGANIIELAEQALLDYRPGEIMQRALLLGMEHVGVNFKAQRVFLPQVMASAEVMKKAFAYLKPMMSQEAAEVRGTVVIATVKGDIHDIGKNIVAMMLENNGFRVIDLGKNVETTDIIQAAKDHQADLICLSSLLTTTMPEMEVVSEQIREHGLSTKLMVGGAVVNSVYADRIGASYGEDAVSAVEVALRLLAQ